MSGVSTSEAPGGTLVITGAFHRAQRGHTKTLLEGQPLQAPPPHEPVRRPARIAIMLALAHKIQRAIDRGVIRDRAEAARRLGITRARVTQILNMTLLAAEIQEQVLLLESEDGIEPIHEHTVRDLQPSLPWARQRAVWLQLQAAQITT